MRKPLSEKFVKQSIIRWLFRNGWGRNLEVGELRDQRVNIRVRNNFTVDKTGKVKQYSWRDLKKAQKK